MSKVFISFVEEFIMNPKFKNYTGGRVEVSHLGDTYPSEELRYFTDKEEEFYRLRKEWDFKHITEEELETLKKILKEKFYDVY